MTWYQLRYYGAQDEDIKEGVASMSPAEGMAFAQRMATQRGE